MDGRSGGAADAVGADPRVDTGRARGTSAEERSGAESAAETEVVNPANDPCRRGTQGWQTMSPDCMVDKCFR